MSSDELSSNPTIFTTPVVVRRIQIKEELQIKNVRRRTTLYDPPPEFADLILPTELADLVPGSDSHEFADLILPTELADLVAGPHSPKQIGQLVADSSQLLDFPDHTYMNLPPDMHLVVEPDEMFVTTNNSIPAHRNKQTDHSLLPRLPSYTTLPRDITTKGDFSLDITPANNTSFRNVDSIAGSIADCTTFYGKASVPDPTIPHLYHNKLMIPRRYRTRDVISQPQITSLHKEKGSDVSCVTPAIHLTRKALRRLRKNVFRRRMSCKQTHPYDEYKIPTSQTCAGDKFIFTKL